MDSLLQTFFKNMAVHLSDGRVQEMARAHRTPLPVLLSDDPDWFVLHRRGDVASVFAAKHQGVKAAGIGRLRACVIGQEKREAGRCLSHVVWFYIDKAGRRAGRTEARYYVSRRNDGLGVDMIQFDTIAFPQLRGWFADNAAEPLLGRRLARAAPTVGLAEAGDPLPPETP